MIVANFNNIKISALSAAVSNYWTSNIYNNEDDISVIKKFIKKTGVEGRYNAGDQQTSSDFCYAAAQEILKKKQIDKNDIGVLVFVTQSPDYRIPATACVLHKRLDLNKNCIAFDVNLGCSGFVYGLNIVSSLLNNSNCKMGLLLCGDTSAKEKSKKHKTKTSHSASMLFGDSGTAVLLEKVTSKPINIVLKTDGNSFRSIIDVFGYYRHPDPSINSIVGPQMDDIAVFNFAVSEVPQLLKNVMDLNSRTPEDYDCLALHQANLFILKQIAKRTGFSMDKTLISLDKFGNTSSSSIPISLVKEYGDSLLNKEIHVLMCGFGVGLSWGAVDCYLNTQDILPLIHTDEFFEDGYTSTEE